MALYSLSLSELRDALGVIEPVRSGEVSVRCRRDGGMAFECDVTGVSLSVDENGLWDVVIEAREIA